MTIAARLLTLGHRIYLAATGAGAGLQKQLWDVPGISRVLVGAELPYAKEALDRFLGFAPAQYCSADTAIAMAMEAYAKAFAPGGAPAIGLGLSASVASVVAHRGEHRVFIATVSERGCWIESATLAKGEGAQARSRDGDLCDSLGLAVLLRALDAAANDPPPSERRECTGDAMRVFLERPSFAASGERSGAPANGNGLTLFPGAFNPPHDAHFWLARDHDATFHVTIDPPHKPHLSVAETLQRAHLLEGFPRLFTRGDPLYLDKARRFPGARILVGVDALERMLDPVWGAEPERVLEELRGLGIKLLVADRETDGRLMTLDDVSLAPSGLCERILGPARHLAMSSTAIRRAMR